MEDYYDMNTATEECLKNPQPTPCELLQKVQFLQRDYDTLLMRYTKKCKERDDLMRTLDQTTVRLNDETARADALQKRCDDLMQSRKAWATKAAELDAKLENAYNFADSMSDENEELIEKIAEMEAHPLSWFLWRHFRKDAKSE